MINHRKLLVAALALIPSVLLANKESSYWSFRKIDPYTIEGQNSFNGDKAIIKTSQNAVVPRQLFIQLMTAVSTDIRGQDRGGALGEVPIKDLIPGDAPPPSQPTETPAQVAERISPVNKLGRYLFDNTELTMALFRMVPSGQKDVQVRDEYGNSLKISKLDSLSFSYIFTNIGIENTFAKNHIIIGNSFNTGFTTSKLGNTKERVWSDDEKFVWFSDHYAVIGGFGTKLRNLHGGVGFNYLKQEGNLYVANQWRYIKAERKMLPYGRLEWRAPRNYRDSGPALTYVMYFTRYTLGGGVSLNFGH